MEQYEDQVSKIERDEVPLVKKTTQQNEGNDNDVLDYTDLITEGVDINVNEADSTALDEAQKIQKWLDKLESFSTIRNVNFMSQFSASENFIIDGESLLKQVFENPQVKNKTIFSQRFKLDWKFGGQFANVIYLFESFLWNIQHRGT